MWANHLILTVNKPQSQKTITSHGQRSAFASTQIMFNSLKKIKFLQELQNVSLYFLVLYFKYITYFPYYSYGYFAKSRKERNPSIPN